jgi:hypothetical protein
MGHFITAAKKGPLPNNGLDVLPFLNSLREKDDVKVYLNSHCEMDYWGWGIGTVIDTLSRGYLRRNASHTGILHATFIKHKHPSHNIPNRDVALVLKLDPAFFSLKTGLQKQQEMSSLIYSCCVADLNGFVTEFRCGDRTYVWKSGQNTEIYGPAPPMLLVEASDSLS